MEAERRVDVVQELQLISYCFSGFYTNFIVVKIMGLERLICFFDGILVVG